MGNLIASALADLPDMLARIPPLWLMTLGFVIYSIITAARQKRGRDAWLMAVMLFACVVCVIYLCLAGDIL